MPPAIKPNFGKLYVGLSTSKVIVFDTPLRLGATPVRSINGPNTKLGDVKDIALDSIGNLYVRNTNNHNITVYDPEADGDASPIFIIEEASTRVFGRGLAIDSDDNLYVLAAQGPVTAAVAGTGAGQSSRSTAQAPLETSALSRSLAISIEES